MSFDLRPQSIPELLDRCFSIYRRDFGLFVGIMALPGLVKLVMSLGWTMMTSKGALTSPSRLEPSQLLASLGAGVVAFGITYVLAWALATGAGTLAVSELFAGRRPTIASMYEEARDRTWALVLLTLNLFARLGLVWVVVGIAIALVVTLPGRARGGTLQAIVLGLLMVLFFLGAVAVALILFLRYAFAFPAMLIENLGSNAAIRRSAFLSSGSKGRIFLLVLCSSVLTYASVLLFQMPFLVAVFVAGPKTALGQAMQLAVSAAGTLGGTLTAPLMVIGSVVLYFDARTRKEALDLQVLLRDLDGGGALGDVPASSILPPPAS